MACESLPGFKFDLAVSCDHNEKCERVVQHNFQPKRFYKNIGECIADESFPKIDLLGAGPDCQPFSSGGSHEGVKDDRSESFFQVLALIHRIKPKAVLLENVEGLVTQFPEFCDFIQKSIKSAGYRVWMDVLNTSQFSIPQNRPRLYVVAILPQFIKKDFKFPTPQKQHATNIADILDDDVGDYMTLPPPSQKTAHRHVIEQLLRIVQQTGNPEHPIRIGDVDSSNCTVMEGRSPCITKARARTGHWIFAKGRRCRRHETMMLQWIDPDRLKKPYNVTWNQFMSMVGNAMNVRMVMLVLAAMRDSAPGAIKHNKTTATTKTK